MVMPPARCPACAGSLGPGPAGLVCLACDADFPVVSGIPLLLTDVDGYLRNERLAVLARTDLPGPVLERLLRGSDNPLARSLRRLWRYSQSTEGPMQARCRELLASLPGPCIELGAGAGGHGYSELVAVDLDFTLLLRHPASVRLVADALRTPFADGSFGSVVALNLLDSCADPAGLLREMLRLRAPEGWLVVVSPFTYEDTITPPGVQLEPAEVEGLLSAAGLRVEVEAHPWPLRIHPRATTWHEGLLFLARPAVG
jgi:SAM-dependent methyltransferase